MANGSYFLYLSAVIFALGFYLKCPIFGRPPSLDPTGKKEIGKILTEFEATKVIAVSELLLEDFEHANKLLREIISAGASVMILSKNPIEQPEKKEWLDKYQLGDLSSHIAVMPIVHDSFWVRDFSPIPIRLNPDVYDRYFLSDFRFRSEFKANDTVSYQMGLYLNLNLIRSPVVMDGGNFISNGESCVVTNDIDYEKKGDIDFRFIRKAFKNYFGCMNLIILNDVPHNHTDMFVKFINKETCV